MGETNLTPRQKLILNLINQSGTVSRLTLQRNLEATHPISKPTLVRDLTILIKNKLIVAAGGGKNTRYISGENNPLLKPFDLEQYFAKDPDERTVTKRSFDFSVFKKLNRLFSSAELEKIQSKFRSFNIQTKTLKPDILKRELERFVIELSWKSSKIEGNTYTLLETENLIKESREPKGRTRRESLMILNHKAAFDVILKHKNQFKIIKISQINELHNVLVKGLEITTGVRTNAVGITGSVYQPLSNKFQITEALGKFINSINRRQNPLEKALITSSLIPYIQPYSDGNKRTARMLTNAILLAHDYFPLSYRSVDEDEFKKSLILFYEQLSLFHLKRIFLEQLVFSYNNYFL